MKVATVVVSDPEIQRRVRAVMRRYGASLQQITPHTDHTVMSFALMPDCDVDMLNRALDAECGAHNFRGKVTGCV